MLTAIPCGRGQRPLLAEAQQYFPRLRRPHGYEFATVDSSCSSLKAADQTRFGSQSQEWKTVQPAQIILRPQCRTRSPRALGTRNQDRLCYSQRSLVLENVDTKAAQSALLLSPVV